MCDPKCARVGLPQSKTLQINANNIINTTFIVPLKKTTVIVSQRSCCTTLFVHDLLGSCESLQTTISNLILHNKSSFSPTTVHSVVVVAWVEININQLLTKRTHGECSDLCTKFIPFYSSRLLMMVSGSRLVIPRLREVEEQFLLQQPTHLLSTSVFCVFFVR